MREGTAWTELRAKVAFLTQPLPFLHAWTPMGLGTCQESGGAERWWEGGADHLAEGSVLDRVTVR